MVRLSSPCTSASNDYHFVTHWKIPGTPAAIFKILKDGKNYSRWWKPAYISTKALSSTKVRAVVRSIIPYTLTFETELIRMVPNKEIILRSSGELTGTGRWQLKKNGKNTDVTFYWEVQATKPLIRWLSPFLKPLFVWNHDWVMKTGETCLKKLTTS